jgi:hypothetical protein
MLVTRGITTCYKRHIKGAPEVWSSCSTCMYLVTVRMKGSVKARVIRHAVREPMARMPSRCSSLQPCVTSTIHRHDGLRGAPTTKSQQLARGY